MKFVRAQWSKALGKVKGCILLRFDIAGAEMLLSMMPKVFFMKKEKRQFLNKENIHCISSICVFLANTTYDMFDNVVFPERVGDVHGSQRSHIVVTKIQGLHVQVALATVNWNHKAH